MAKTVADRIVDLNPCKEALVWAARYTDPEKAWKECQRGDWMLWLIGQHSGLPESDARKLLVLCACECARLSLPIFEKKYPNDNQVRKCLETAEQWAKGEATIEKLKTARNVAYAANAAAAAAAAAAANAAYAAYAAYAANAAAAAAAANATTRKECADIVRKHYSKPPEGKSNGKE